MKRDGQIAAGEYLMVTAHAYLKQAIPSQQRQGRHQYKELAYTQHETPTWQKNPNTKPTCTPRMTQEVSTELLERASSLPSVTTEQQGKLQSAAAELCGQVSNTFQGHACSCLFITSACGSHSSIKPSSEEHEPLISKATSQCGFVSVKFGSNLQSVSTKACKEQGT